MAARTIAIVDGMNFVFRAEYGFPARILNSQKRDVTCIFGFFALVRKALRQVEGEYELICVFDGQNAASTRKSELTDYKSNREDIETSFLANLKYIFSALSALRVKCIESETIEADDLIAGICATSPKRPVRILSADKDFYQLVDDRVKIINTQMKTEQKLVDAVYIAERFGIEPRDWVHYRAMTGDPSDNIKGIKGIGPKRAKQIIRSGLPLDAPIASDGICALSDRLADDWDDFQSLARFIKLRPEPPPSDLIQDISSSELPAAREVLSLIGMD